MSALHRNGTTARSTPAVLDVTTPNVARMYDYYLGGKDHFAVDRDLADRVLTHAPDTRQIARENRAFLGRAVRFLAGETGMSQFLDIGAGLPTQANVHQIAQDVQPGARVVYVDNDLQVLAHARALLADNVTHAIGGDLRKPTEILAEVGLRELIDLSEPVAVLLAAVLEYIEDDLPPIVSALVDAMAPGSCLMISHVERQPHLERAAMLYRTANALWVPRSRDEIGRLFSGLDLVAPGLVRVSQWRPNVTPTLFDERTPAGAYSAIGVKR
jgi:hypothetical protein